LTSIALLPPTAWHDPFAVQPSQAPDFTVLTQAAADSVLITIPCSVAKIIVPFEILEVMGWF